MKRLFTDMTGHQVEVSLPPQRIISLVPSQTELLYDLGLDERVIGITKFCIHPNSWFRNKQRIGGTKNVNIDLVKSLQPDLILANKEENTREQVEELAALFPVWTSNIQTRSEACGMITQVGEITGTAEKAAQLVSEINKEFETLPRNCTGLKVAYFIWRNPWMCAGGDTFISDMIGSIGWENALAGVPRYPSVALQELASLQIDMVLLSSEPYPFKDKHIAEIQAALPGAKVMLVDGEMFSWYGSRMKLAPGYFRTLVVP